MLKKILIGVVVLVAAVLVAAALQPDEFRIERSMTIAAPAESIFPLVNNLKKFNEWSPWAKLDPNATAAFDGPEEGVGAKLTWNGNYEVGQGSMTSIESLPNELVRYRMDFIKPMESTSTAEFVLKAETAATTVTWALYGSRTYLCKLTGMIFRADKMVGDQFEKGLNNLKTLVEGSGE